MILSALLLQAAAPTLSPCTREEKVGDSIVVHRGPGRICRKWRAPRSFKGIWFYQLEGSQFVPDVRTPEEAASARRAKVKPYWFDFDDQSRFPTGCRPVLGRAYGIAFTGREAVPEAGVPGPFGGFGHMGMWSREVLLDRITALEDLGDLPGDQVRPVGFHARCSAFNSGNRR